MFYNCLFIEVISERLHESVAELVYLYRGAVAYSDALNMPLDELIILYKTMAKIQKQKERGSRG